MEMDEIEKIMRPLKDVSPAWNGTRRGAGEFLLQFVEKNCVCLSCNM